MHNRTRKASWVLGLGTLALAALALSRGDDMFTLHTEIDIEAPPEAVWATLTDAKGFSEWNPFIHELKGELRVGNTLDVTVGAPGKSRMRFKPLVLRVDENRELRWRGKLLITGVMDGEHVYELQRTATGTRFLHYENFSGLLVPLLKGMLERDTKPGFEAMNRALKQRAETIQLASR